MKTLIRMKPRERSGLKHNRICGSNGRIIELGCMRMRKLGHGHSVMFFSPHEVVQSICTLVGKKNQDIATADILRWAIHETWSDIQQHAPHWAQQGINHQSRYDAWSSFCQNQNPATAKQLVNAWVQPELMSLMEMYMPGYSQSNSFTNLPLRIRDHCASLGVLSLSADRMDEEREREVSREIERSREVEWPLEAFPANHSLHPEVVQLVRTSVISSSFHSTALCHVFATNAKDAWSPYILATADFCKTIHEDFFVQFNMNDYLRPVQWILSGKMDNNDVLILLNPFEADRLMLEIRISKHVRLHLYIPRTTKRMKPYDDLGLYSVPSLPLNGIPRKLIDQLNVFAGQLYLKDHDSYTELCQFLGIRTKDLRGKTSKVLECNWLSNPRSINTKIIDRLTGTPLSLAMLLLAIRQGMGFGGTHMGRVLEGWPLTKEDF